MLDENMPKKLASMLRTAGHDVSRVQEAGHSGEDDPPILEAAAAEGRILMTMTPILRTSVIFRLVRTPGSSCFG